MRAGNGTHETKRPWTMAERGPRLNWCMVVTAPMLPVSKPNMKAPVSRQPLALVTGKALKTYRKRTERCQGGKEPHP